MQFTNSGFFTILISLLLLTLSSNVNLSFSSSTQQNTVPVEFDTESFLQTIIQKLRSEAQYDNESLLLGWPLSINGYEDDFIERGYRTGLTGIGDFLLEAHLSGFTEGDDLLNETIQHLTTRHSTSKKGLYWTRFVGLISEAWTSYRYGALGILDFLSRYNQIFPITNYSHILSSGLRWLKSTQLETGDFPMAPNSYITTDFEYGATGIAQGLLNIYKRDQNSTFLFEAVNITDWLIDRGIWKGQTFRIPWTLYGDETEFVDESYKSLTSGMAGVLHLMLDVYQVTNNSLYLDVAKGIGKYLVDSELNGQWEETAVNYVTKIGRNDGLIGYHVGSTGIALSLLRMEDVTGEQYYLDTAQRVENHVNHLINQDGSVPISEEQQDKLYAGFSMGQAGIAYYHLLQYERFGNKRNLNLAISILNHLYEIYEDNQLIPFDEELPKRGYYLNLEHGIAGLGKVLLKFMSFVPDISFVDQPSTTPNNFISQLSDLDRNLLAIGVLSAALIIVVIMRKYTK